MADLSGGGRHHAAGPPARLHSPQASTRVTTTPPRVPFTPGPARRRRRLPARVLIMLWVMLLLLSVLSVVVLVTRNLALQDVDARADEALNQEIQEFVAVAERGVDRGTGQPFDSVEQLLRNHVDRQFPDDEETIFGVVEGPGRYRVLQQDRVEPFRFAGEPDLVARVLRTEREGGRFRIPGGGPEVAWAKVLVDDPDDAGVTGTYIVGYGLTGERDEVRQTVERLVLVSVGGLLLAGVGAWLISGQILAPVRLVRLAAAEITEQDLSRRIPVDGSDDVAALSEQFNAMLDRLQEAFAGQRQFLDDASHELRTPITIVHGHLELMGDDPAERAEVVRLVIDELQRMSRIVEDLLLLAKAERQDFVRPEEVSVAELTSDIDAKARALGERRWVLEAIGEEVVEVDPQRVTQAVVQLAQNAVQHTRTGDEIRIGSAVHRDAAGVGWVSFWVSDTGPGVRPADATEIFERFSRGSTGGSRANRAGAGLGLAIVRAIAEGHRGVVRLVSEPGEGATFGVELPAHQDRPAPSP